MREDDTSETEIFIRNIDKFFDCLNVRSLDEGTKKRKPNLQPFKKSDEHLQVGIISNAHFKLYS